MAKQAALVAEGPLRYYASSDTTVLAATSRGRFKLFRIVFGRDGSIYLPFPYLETKTGLLSEASPSDLDPRTLDLKTNGMLVSTDVKFSHHRSGIVQFSRSGDVAVLPRRQSFELTRSIGRVFELHVYGLEGFAQFTAAKKTDFLLPFQFQDHPSGLRVTGEWLRKSDMIANLEPGGRWFGPDTFVFDRRTATEKRCLLIGQPSGHVLRDHILLLSADTVPLAEGADVSTMIFLGGFDPHEGQAPASATRLAFLYPVA